MRLLSALCTRFHVAPTITRSSTPFDRRIAQGAPMKLTSNDVVSLFRSVTGSSTLPSKLTVLLPAGRPALVKFAGLLAAQTDVHTVAGDGATHEAAIAQGLRCTVAAKHVRNNGGLNRFAALTAVRNKHGTVVLPETAHDQAQASLCTLLGALPAKTCAPLGCEMLPANALTFIRPLLKVDPGTLGESPPSFGVDIKAAALHGTQRAEAADGLRRLSDSLLRSAILEASHWGYLVVRRSVLARAYCAGGGDRLIALDALSRAMAHVSGGSQELLPTAEHVSRMAASILSDAHDPKPLPKGRTAAGMVVRRATGRFARRVAQADSERRGTRRKRVSHEEDDLMIFTREPDHEGTGLFAQRLSGNAACLPLEPSGAVYWDNRYVMLAAPVSQLRDHSAIVDETTILDAALRAPYSAASHDIAHSEMREASLYVRQLRRADWERITAATERVRSFQVPFECIRALPGIFQKDPRSSNVGLLAASPHLGLTSCADLFFTAVCVPRYRTLPDDICPGFVLKDVCDAKDSTVQKGESGKMGANSNRQKRIGSDKINFAKFGSA